MNTQIRTKTRHGGARKARRWRLATGAAAALLIIAPATAQDRRPSVPPTPPRAPLAVQPATPLTVGQAAGLPPLPLPSMAPLAPLPGLPAPPAPPSAGPMAANRRALLAQRSTRTKHIARTFPVRGRTVELAGQAMDLRVEAGTGDQAELVVDLEYWSSSDEWMDRVEREYDVIVDERSDSVSVRASNLPHADESWWRRILGTREVSWAMDVVLRVPAATALEIENRYGSIDVGGIAGTLVIDSASGDVTVRGSGTVQVDNSYGPVRVVETTGDVRVRSSSADVHVGTVSGNADLETSYGGLTVLNVGGELRGVSSSGSMSVNSVGGRATLTNSYAAAEIVDVGTLELRSSSGDVTVRTVRGDADIEASYGHAVVESVAGRLDIANSSGAVTVTDVGAGATISNSYAPVRVSRITGALRIDSASAAVAAEDISGSVDIRTSYAGVELRGVDGEVRIRNQSGRVEVEGFRGAALQTSHSIETSYADVRVDWPGGTPLAFDAESTYGRIDSDFEGRAVGSSSSRQRITSDGAGAGRIDIVATSGSITLRRR